MTVVPVVVPMVVWIAWWACVDVLFHVLFHTRPQIVVSDVCQCVSHTQITTKHSAVQLVHHPSTFAPCQSPISSDTFRHVLRFICVVVKRSEKRREVDQRVRRTPPHSITINDEGDFTIGKVSQSSLGSGPCQSQQRRSLCSSKSPGSECVASIVT